VINPVIHSIEFSEESARATARGIRELGGKSVRVVTRTVCALAARKNVFVVVVGDLP
jgi:hypothetical protein